MGLKKRGYHLATVTLVPAICLLLVFGFFFVPLLLDIMGIQETTYFEKNFLIRDMATLTTTLYASPGNIIVDYDKDTMIFNYEFNKEAVAIIDETLVIDKKTGYKVISDGLNFNPAILNAEFYSEEKTKKNLKERVKPIFAKINDRIIIGKVIDMNINELDCMNTEITGKNKIVLVDAGHGGWDEGVVASNIKEKDITGSIGFSIHQKIGGYFTRDNIGGPVNEQIRRVEYNTKEKIIPQINANNINMIISIHAGSYDDDSNNVKAYYSIESDEHVQSQSKRVACKVLNELINKEELEISGISMVPIYPEDYEGGDILVKDKVAVLFEIGNLQNNKGVSMLTNSNAIIDSITKGLENAE